MLERVRIFESCTLQELWKVCVNTIQNIVTVKCLLVYLYISKLGSVFISFVLFQYYMLYYWCDLFKNEILQIPDQYDLFTLILYCKYIVIYIVIVLLYCMFFCFFLEVINELFSVHNILVSI